jgi:hypothetical protein
LHEALGLIASTERQRERDLERETETEMRLSGTGGGDIGERLLIGMGLPFGTRKMLWREIVVILHNFVNTLKTTELHILAEQISWNGNYILIFYFVLHLFLFADRVSLCSPSWP